LTSRALVGDASGMVPLAHIVQTHARERGDAIALVSAAPHQGGERRTYRELAARSARMARCLRDRHGVRRGDRIAILALNDVRTFELLVAASALGAAIVPLNLRLTERELEPVVRIADPKVLFVDEAHAALLAGATVPRARFVDEDLLAKGGFDGVDGTLDDALVILFTSGTTGRPKGAILPARAIAANAESTRRAWELTSGDAALVDAPLFHTGGLNVLATPLLYVGGRVVVLPRFEATASAETLLAEKCTVAFGVPTMIERLLVGGFVDKSAVRLWVTGGAPCPPSLLDAFAQRGLRLLQGFGMTECGPNCFRPLAGAARGSVGTPTFDLEARLVGEDGTDVAAGEPGELWLRGPQVFSGYLNDPHATSTALAGGWLHTGDVLRATDEGWFVAGRKKEMFISGGENVYPAEVENATCEHPSVAEAAVVAIPDPKWGEAGVAFVVLRAAEGAVSADDLRAFLKGRIAGYKVPKTIAIEKELPRTPLGKIDKQALVLRARASAAPAK
jgi:fatty-acyl-CoA synthase